MLSVGLTVSSVNVNGIRAAAQNVKNSGFLPHERAATHSERWADHAPVTATYGPA